MPFLGRLSSMAHLRAGDAEREQVAGELTRHCAEGRLTVDELSERLEAAYGARTRGELAALTRDLPRLAPASASRVGRRRRLRTTAWLAAGVAVLGLALLTAGLAELVTHDPLGAALAVVVLVACVLLAVAALASLLAALAPLVAAGLAVCWIGRRVGTALDGRPPRTRLRA